MGNVTLSGWMALLGAGLCAAVASTLLKSAASLDMPWLSTRALALAVAAVAVYGVGFALYGYSLRYFAVGIAYVCMVAVAAIMLFAYMFASGQPVHLRQWVGAVVIVLGVFLIVGARPQ